MASVPYPAFWFGENLIQVSHYIKDAPYKHLRLIASGLIHDWNWLLSDNLDSAQTIGATVWGLGIVVCVVVLGGGVYFAVQGFREYSWKIE